MGIEINDIKKFKGATGKDRTKSKSKQIGVKATFVTQNGIAISSHAEIENEQGKKVPNIEIMTSKDGSETYRKNLKLLRSAQIDFDTVRLEGSNDNVEFANPAKTLSGGDYIGIKSALERKYFKGEFPNDNIHVQIAYNIADMKKHLMQFVNQILYSFLNINRAMVADDRKDIIGTICCFCDYERYDESQLKKYGADKLMEGVHFYDAYFPNVFKIAKKNKNGVITEDAKKQAAEHNFNIFRLLSLLRQACEHETHTKGNWEGILYNMEGTLKATSPSLVAVLDELYKNVVDKVNADFDLTGKKPTASNNLYMLSQIYPEISKEELYEKYYRYVVYKEQNNIGINIKLIREIIIEKYMPEIRDKGYDTVRQKLYTLFGFALSKYLTGSDIASEAVARLRSNSGEDGRLSIYLNLADKVWGKIGATLKKLVYVIDKEKNNKFKSTFDLNDEVKAKPYSIKSNKARCFTKLINLMTRFLDGKEINELLTGLISRFNNVADLSDSANECGITIAFANDYFIFAKAREIANELHILKTVAKMKPDLSSVKNNMLLDAAEILGWQGKAVSLMDLTAEEQKDKNSAFLKKIYKENSDREKDGKKDNRLRNFIINNVIKSKWFFYIARYTKPSVCKKLMTNKNLIAFVLKEIPDTQIARYYKSVTDFECMDAEKARERLIEHLYNFKIDNVLDKIEGISDREYKSQTEGSIKQKNQAIVGLYLTVAYLLIKNMVKINSVFSIAFSCLERDKKLLNIGVGDDKIFNITEKVVSRDSALVEKYNSIRDSIRDSQGLSHEEKKAEYKEKLKPILKKMHYDLHGYYYVKANLENAKTIDNVDSNFLREYRNAVVHINIPAEMVDYIGDIKEITSYYSIYVYCLERSMLKRFNFWSPDLFTDFMAKQRSIINQTGRYSSDMLWVLNVAFAYNMARYKNLCVEDLFYGKYIKAPLEMPEKIVTKSVHDKKGKNEGKQKENTPPKQSTQIALNMECPETDLIGKTVVMVAQSVSAAKALRGVIVGKAHTASVSKKMLREAGVVCASSYIGKSFKVEITGWDKQSALYIARIVK